MKKVVIIGGGIVGCFLAHDLSKYEVEVHVIERNMDVCEEVSAANSAIVHAGYDPEEGTLKALLNKRGSDMYPSICKELHVDYKKIGAYILACSDEEKEQLDVLYQRGRKRGVRMEYKNRIELLKEEPNISSHVIHGVSVPDTAIITPWEVGVALMEEAMLNGVLLHLNEDVQAIHKEHGMYTVQSSKMSYQVDYVINAAGHGAYKIMEMVETTLMPQVEAKRGQYYILSKKAKDVIHHILYPTPSIVGKGVLCIPTIHGNTLIGPNSEILQELDTSTSKEGLDDVRCKALKMVENIPFQEVIHSYSGVRPCGNHNDFLIEESTTCPNIIHLAYIDSPGLASAPAISEYVLSKILDVSSWNVKETMKRRLPSLRMNNLSIEEKQKAIMKQPAFGRIVCRCEMISEQEIVDSIHRECGASSIKGVKKRVRPGMGKCQGGFCEVEVAKILARELNIPLHKVRYDKTEYFERVKGEQ